MHRMLGRMPEHPIARPGVMQLGTPRLLPGPARARQGGGAHEVWHSRVAFASSAKHAVEPEPEPEPEQPWLFFMPVAAAAAAAAAAPIGGRTLIGTVHTSR